MRADGAMKTSLLLGQHNREYTQKKQKPTPKLCVLKGWILWYVDRISIKLLLKGGRQHLKIQKDVKLTHHLRNAN